MQEKDTKRQGKKKVHSKDLPESRKKKKRGGPQDVEGSGKGGGNPLVTGE